jgi:hypothetical protein
VVSKNYGARALAVIRRNFLALVVFGMTAVGFSSLSIGINIASVAYIMNVMDVGSWEVRNLAVAFPATMIVNTVPITPNGLGIGESAFGTLMAWLESKGEERAFIDFGFCFLVWRFFSMMHSLIGLVFVKDLLPVVRKMRDGA